MFRKEAAMSRMSIGISNPGGPGGTFYCPLRLIMDASYVGQRPRARLVILPRYKAI
jgi:hypothetical protein